MDSLVDGPSIGTGTSAERLASEIGLTAEEIAWRKEFIDFSAEDERRVADLDDVVEANMDALVEAFIDPVYEHDRTRDVVDRSPRTRSDIEGIVEGYMRMVTGGQYDTEYFTHRTRIGRLHDRLEMPLHYFGGMFANLLNTFFETLQERTIDAATAELDATDAAAVEDAIADGFRDSMAVTRILNLDMQVVNDTYLHSYSADLREEIERSRELRAEVGDSVATLRTEANGAAKSADRIDSLAEEQSDHTEDIAGKVSTLSATIEEIASTADQVSSRSGEAEALATDGLDAAAVAESEMQELDNERTEIMGEVDELVDAVDEIDEIVEVINDIADQTNLLALNASIEAARAGEAGSGFAVVADEVKSLANESKEQAERVEAMIDTVTARIDRTATGLDEVGESIDSALGSVDESVETLEGIVDAVEETSDGIDEVARAADEQAEASSDIARVVDEAAEHATEVAAEVDVIADNIRSQSETADEVDAALSELQADTSRAEDGGGQARSATDGGLQVNDGDDDGGLGPFTNADPISDAGDDSGRRGNDGTGDARSDSTAGDPISGLSDAELRAALPDGIPEAIRSQLSREKMESIVRQRGGAGGR
ncbi:MAG: globin-coupled sensor protein [Halobellus sp.]|uniref:globin-coupled sensor protein n=1 Tax=Halobellus sp. TaxID=1979212 RepID=UPI0035D4915E